MYVREIDGRRLTLQVSGKLWMRSLVMSDVETGTEWSHLLGKGMAGPLKGRRLKPLVTDMVTWAVWKNEHPETTVLNMSRTHRDYSDGFYRDPSRFLFGFNIGSKHFALPMKLMQQNPVFAFEAANRHLLATFDNAGKVTHLFETDVDGRRLEFEQIDLRVMKDKQTGSRWEILNGRCIGGPLKGKLLRQRVGIMSFRRAWENFHPDSVDISAAPAGAS